MIKLFTLLAVLASPVQAEELRSCRDIAIEFIDQAQAEGLLPAGLQDFPDAIMINFTSKDELHKVTLLVTVSPEGYSLKDDAKVEREGYCDLKGVKAYYGVAIMSDPQSRAAQ